jgi:exonuclease SbcC
MAALLRTLSKGMERQIVVAVHERALFDYLTLELSPSFQGDSLITVEVSKNFEGNTVVSAQTYGFEKDPAIAA